MKLKDWKDLWFYVMLASSSTIWCCSSVKVVKASHVDKQTKQEEPVSNISFLGDSRLISIGDRAQVGDILVNLQPETILSNSLSQEQQSIPIVDKDNCSGSKMLPMTSTSSDAIIFEDTFENPDLTNSGCVDLLISNSSNRESPSKIIKTAQNESPPSPPTPENVEKNPPPLDSQPTDLPTPSPEEIEKKLDSLKNENSKRLERLLQRLAENKKKSEQPLNAELGVIRAQQIPTETPQLPEPKLPPPTEKPVAKIKPIGYLLGNVGYFHTSNIFSSGTNTIDDGLIFTGLTLAAAPFKIGSRTYLNGSINGSIITYSNQSEFNYNQLRLNLGILQQLSSRMYSEIGWSNQQLFYAKDSDSFNFSSGDKFLDENSFRFSLGRRDPITPKLNLDSFYELRLSITDPPEKRNRIINYAWFSLNYNLQQSLRMGIDYQFNLSNFLERSREDQYHRLSANLKYRISDLSSINLQSGYTLGGSTDSNIDFDGWFFSVNYNLDLGKF
ncbi:MAG: hypothetical protein VKN72_04060 [Nostocales cyanobacterium 94392]|nr:hypothetical protein [Nostocales cyanobacterium 94392]